MKKIETISFTYKNKTLQISAKICTFVDEIFGLMFKNSRNADALLFDFKKPVKMKIHSLFVFFPFLAIWLDEENKVLEIKKVKPFTFVVEPLVYFNKLIEMPINKKYKNYINQLISRR